MTVYNYGFEDGTDETAYTIDTTAAAGATILADSAQAAHGSLGLRVDSTVAGYHFVQKNLPATVTSAAVRFYIYQDAAITNGTHELFRFQSDIDQYTNPGCALNIQLNGVNKLRINDNVNRIWTASSALSAATWYRIEIYVQCDAAGAAVISGGYYVGDSTTAEQTFSITTATTTATILSARLGRTSSATYDTNHYTWLDDWAIDDAPTGLIGPYDGSNTVPVADAGSDQADVRSYATVQLDGTGSSDADMDTLTYAWTQTAGLTVMLDDTASATPSFTAPATTMGAVLTFQLVVNDGQADSAPDTVDVAVSPHDMWRIADPAGPTFDPIKISQVE